MDIIATLGGSRLYTLHSHTQFCDGRASMDDFAREAVKQGFTHYGFSPHSPIPFESPCNMAADDVRLYDEEFNRIRDTYGHRVTFLRSMEIDYLGDRHNATTPYFRSLGLDYSISSVHFIPSQDGAIVDIDGQYESFRTKMSQYFHDDIRYVVEKFYEHSLRMVATGGFDIIGHLDKIAHNASQYCHGIEDEPWYQALVYELIDRVADAGVIAEINTKSFARSGRMFPAVKLWPRLIERGIPLVINSDAHYPDMINAGRQEAYSILESLR